MTRSELERRTSRHLARSGVLANLTGAVVVYVFLSYLLVTPVDLVDDGRLQGVNTVVFVVYMSLMLAAGGLVGRWQTRGLWEWLRRDAPADNEVRRLVLALPLRLSLSDSVAWFGAVLVFGALNASYTPVLGFQVAATIALGGLTTVPLGYLLTERLLRPVVTLAHVGAPDPPPILLGVSRRMVLAWAVASGVPLLGIGMGMVELANEEPLSPPAVLFLVAVGLVVGLAATVTAARAVADPVQSVAAALREVAAGRLDTSVPVYDASEIGQLQTGFNAMAVGLRERAALQDLFGRQVGTDVARLALERGARLGGERRDVAVLYVDVIGSTALAVSRDPEEVVRQLNLFFGVVVTAVADNGGWVNKFEGDAALCVFGAPVDREDAGGRALAAARALAKGLEPLELDAAIGVCAGPVVAGNIGTETRFEYTVIGDAVNTAARLAELARAWPGHVLADGAVVQQAGHEAAQWEMGDEVLLRGRSTPTRLASPLGERG